MNLQKLLLMISNAGGWDNLSPSSITADDYASTFGDANDDNFAAAIQTLDTNKVVIAYAYFAVGSTSGSNRLVVAEVNPTTGVVTFGTPADFGSVYSDAAVAAPSYIFDRSIAILSTTAFVFAWTDVSGYGKCRVGSVSGTTITLGTVNNIQTNSNVTIRYISAMAFDATRVVFVYRVWGGTNIRASHHTVSGTTLTYRSIITFTANVAYTMYLSFLDSTHILVSLGNGSNAGYNSLSILSYSGTTLSVGTLLQISTATAAEVSTVVLSTTTFVAFFRESNVWKFKRYSVSGTTITQVSASAVSFESLVPTATLRITTLPLGAAMVLVKTEGTSYILSFCIQLGNDTNTLRPHLCVFRFVPATETITRIASVYLFTSTTAYSRWAATLGVLHFCVLNSSFITGYGFIKDGTTYTMKLIKIRV